MDRIFKGVWIPCEIWLDKNLDVMEKTILVEIDSVGGLQNCLANKQHFVDFLQITKENLSVIIDGLIQKGYLGDYKRNLSLKQAECNTIYQNEICDRLKGTEGVTKEEFASETIEKEANQELDVVVESLIALGLDADNAIRILDIYGLPEVKERLYALTRKTGIKNAAGWLIAALKHKYTQTPLVPKNNQTVDTGRTRIEPLSQAGKAYSNQLLEEIQTHEINEYSPFAKYYDRLKERTEKNNGQAE